jgi:hypothetical protein
MGRILRLTAVAALLALCPLASFAQATDQPFAGTFDYSDRNGEGTLTITPLAADSAPNGIQRFLATLTQAGLTLVGVGAYYAPGATETEASPAFLSFTLIDAGGASYYYQARLTAENQGFVGHGTYFLVAEPQTEYSWSIQSQAPVTPPQPPAGTEPATQAIESSLPSLVGEWSETAMTDALGGLYYAVANQAAAPVQMAIWRGSLPAAGQYRVEAFIPAAQEGTAPRTERATYLVSGGLTETEVAQVSQNVATSQWVSLGTFTLGTEYEVVLTDETGEPAFTHSVVANALRFIPVAVGS